MKRSIFPRKFKSALTCFFVQIWDALSNRDIQQNLIVSFLKAECQRKYGFQFFEKFPPGNYNLK
jgi:hypothetical protein